MDIILDYIKAKECNNVNAWFTCHKCGCCGRIFNDDGVMIDANGTHFEEDDDE